MGRISSRLRECCEKLSSTFTSQKDWRISCSAQPLSGLFSRQRPRTAEEIFCSGTGERKSPSSYGGHSAHIAVQSSWTREFKTTNLRELRLRRLPAAYTERLSQSSINDGPSWRKLRCRSADGHPILVHLAWFLLTVHSNSKEMENRPSQPHRRRFRHGARLEHSSWGMEYRPRRKSPSWSRWTCASGQCQPTKWDLSSWDPVTQSPRTGLIRSSLSSWTGFGGGWFGVISWQIGHHGNNKSINLPYRKDNVEPGLFLIRDRWLE